MAGWRDYGERVAIILLGATGVLYRETDVEVFNFTQTRERLFRSAWGSSGIRKEDFPNVAIHEGADTLSLLVAR